MFLRPGSLLDLTVIAYGANRRDDVFDGLPYSTVTSYITGERPIKQQNVQNIAEHFAAKAEPLLIETQPDFKIKAGEHSLAYHSCVSRFIECYQYELNIRRMFSEISPFSLGRCSAQVIADYLSFCDRPSGFNVNYARELLELFILKPIPENRDAIIGLSFIYLSQRIAKEGFWIDFFYPFPKRMLSRDINKIKKINNDVLKLIALDANNSYMLKLLAFYALIDEEVHIKNLPPTPILKFPTTIDVLMLCPDFSTHIISSYDLNNNSKYSFLLNERPDYIPDYSPPYFLFSCTSPWGTNIEVLLQDALKEVDYFKSSSKKDILLNIKDIRKNKHKNNDKPPV